MADTMDEKKLEQEFKQAIEGRHPMNVVESAPLYDTILVCSDYYGQEAAVNGWYTTFGLFAQARDYKFMKSRTEGTAGLPYCNMQSADSMPYPFYAYTMGITFFAPSSNIIGSTKYHSPNGGGGETWPYAVDPIIPHFWQFDLPRHAAIIFRTNQDVRAENTCYTCPPGYGPMGGGAAFEINTYDDVTGFAAYKQHAALNTFGTQGVPVLHNRFKFPKPIAIPKNATIEGELVLSKYARDCLADMIGPFEYLFSNVDLTTIVEKFPMRFGIQFSLFGLRMVQQRGQYHVS